MRGRILDYSVQTNEGIITGEDGFRYTFSGSEWREAATPARGSAVDFDVVGVSAVGVYHALDGAPISATPIDLPRSGTPTAQGQVLAYSVQDGSGLISGDDGIRYTFASAEWREQAVPSREMRVEFAVDGSAATAVYQVQPTRPGGAVGDAVGSFLGNLRAGVSAGATPDAGRAVVPVSAGQRFVGYLVEVGVRIAMSILVGLVIGLPLGLVTLGFGLLLMPIIGSAILFGYYWLMYAMRSAGLGHMAIGAIIVNYNTGVPISGGRAAARAACVTVGSWFFPIVTLVNGIMVLASDDRRHLYDLIAGTLVVQRQ